MSTARVSGEMLCALLAPIVWLLRGQLDDIVDPKNCHGGFCGKPEKNAIRKVADITKRKITFCRKKLPDSFDFGLRRFDDTSVKIVTHFTLD